MHTDFELKTEMNSSVRILKNLLSRKGRIAIAFSGGVDSSLLAAMAVATCEIPPVALTVSTLFQSAGEIEYAKFMAGKIGVAHEVLILDLAGDEQIVMNPENRCYFCKKTVFSVIRDRARELGALCVAHGINLDDLNDFRPGIQAAKELGFESPLIESGFSKGLVRQAAKKIGLDNWNRPSQSCLATRIPYGTPITPALLSKIEQAENYLNNLGLKAVRVRCHGILARIEVERQAMEVVFENREIISRYLKDLGFEHVTVDIGTSRSAGG